MANIKSAKKRMRQNEKRRIKNSSLRSSIRTASKKAVQGIESKDEKDSKKIKELFINFVKLIDTASRKGIVHKNTAARKKSRLAKKMNARLMEQDG